MHLIIIVMCNYAMLVQVVFVSNSFVEFCVPVTRCPILLYDLKSTVPLHNDQYRSYAIDRDAHSP
jgi:hypothetical protein